jgi:hypothetical protein
MASITTRETSAGVGDRAGITNANTPLTNAQIDANFIALNNDKLEISDGSESATPSTVVKRTSSGGINVVGLDASGQIDAQSLILDTALAISEGGTGATTAAGARNNLGLDTDDNVQFRSLGVGVSASGTAGEIRATNCITSYYSSDIRLKENITNIPNAMDKLLQLNGVEYDWTDNYIQAHGGEDGYFMRKHDIGLIAQEVEAVLPEIVAENNEGYKAIKYERVVALLVEAVKELNKEVNELRSQKL